MAATRSEGVAAEAFEEYRNGNLREFIHTLVDFADRSVNNKTTERAFKRAIDTELAKTGEAPSVSEPDEGAPRCAHCGSTSTYFRLSDGDVACNNCPGIMPRDEVDT